MALYNEMSMDDYNKLVARNQQRQSQAAAQNLANRQAALQAAQGKKQGSLVDTLVGLATGLKDKAVDAYDTAKNIGKTVVGGINQIGANKEVENRQKDDSKRRNEIAKKYGFNSYSEAANSGNASDDFWNEIKGTAKETQQNLKNDADWRKSQVGNVQDINLNKAAGQALNTIDTVGMALSGPSGVAANILGGGLAGIGDQYKAAAESGEKTNDLLSTIPSKFNLKNAAAGMAGGAAGSAAGGLLGKAATKAGGNLLGKALGSQLGQGIGSGAAAGAAGAAAGTLAQGGSLQDALSNAWEGAKGGAVAGGAMAGTMGLAGNALNRIRSGNAANIADNAPIRNAEPVEAQIVQKNRVEAPTAQRIEAEAPSTRRGIAITDLDAGEQPVMVKTTRRGSAQANGYQDTSELGNLFGKAASQDNIADYGLYGKSNAMGANGIGELYGGEQPVNVRNARQTASQGKYIDSVVRRSDANLPEAKMPTYDQRFSKLENIGDNNLLDALNNRKSVYGQEYAYENLIEDMTPALRERVKEAVREGAEYNNPYREFEQYGIYSQSDLPQLNRQEYYEDTYGKLKNKGGIMSAEDIPSYMQPHLSDQIPRGNDVILSELFQLGSGAEQKQDLTDSYDLYDRIAQTRAPKKTYSQENLATGLALDDQLRADITKQLVDKYAPTRKISIEKALGQTQDVPVENLATNYQRSTIPAKQYEQAVAKMPEAETTTPKPVVENATIKTEPELDYNTQLSRQKAQIAADKAKMQATRGVLEQYGTTRLSDRIEGLPNAIQDMLDLGLADRAEIDLFSKKLASGDSELAKAIRKSLNDAGNIDANTGFTWEQVFAASGAQEPAQKKIKSFYDAQSKKYQVNADGTMTRSDMYDLGKSLEKEGYKRYDRGVRNQNNTDYEMGEALINMSQDIIGKATDGVDVSGKFDANKLKSLLPGNEAWANKVDTLNANAKTVQDLRSAMASATKMNLLKQAEEYNMNTYGQNVGGKGKGSAAVKAAKSFLTGKPLAAAEAGAEIVLGSNPVKQKAIKKSYDNYKKYQAQANGEAPAAPTGKVAQAKQFIADKTGRVGETAKNIAGKAGEKIGNATANLNNETLSNIGLNDGLTLGTYMANQANRQIGAEQARDAVERMNNARAVANAQSDYDNALAGYQAQEATYNNQMAQLQSQTGNTATLNRIAQAMDLAMAAGDINAYSQLADLYKQAYNIYEMQNPTAKNDGKALTSTQSKALAGLQQLETLKGMKSGARTALADSPLGALIDLTGGDEYSNQAKSLALTLGYLQSGANITPKEAEKIGKAYIPTAFDSEETRQGKLARAEQLLRDYLADTSALQA